MLVSAKPASTAHEMIEQLLDQFPAHSYALTALLRLVEIRTSTDIPTAAVQCKAQPALLINPDFVARHAATPERLMMLVMHELHHVILGHTTLFPRSTPAHNLVFDAVINALLCRMFPSKVYTAFFTDLYSDARFPECLLRPAVGWPEKPRALKALRTFPEARRVALREIHTALYSESGASYHELFSLLPGLLGEGASSTQDILLGDHTQSDRADGHTENISPMMAEIVRDIVGEWPQPPDPIQGRSLADVLKTVTIKPQLQTSRRQQLRTLIRQIAGAGGAESQRRLGISPANVASALPGTSRSALVMRQLGVEPLLFPQPVPLPGKVPESERVHIYVDVSGSMDAIKRPLYGAIIDCAALVKSPVHLFSTKVEEISFAELRAGKCRSTGGTDIDCVARHIAEHQVRRAVIITDGQTGKPQGKNRGAMDQARIGVAFVGKDCHVHDLADIARHSIRLDLEATV